MSSRYVAEMQNTIKGYHQRVQAARQRVDTIRADYGDEAAQREQERQQTALQRERATAEAAIRDAYSEGVFLAQEWGKLAGGDLTDDAKLLEGDLVNPAQFNELKAKYSGNATMLAALKKYGDRQNAAAIQAAHDRGDHAGAWGAGGYDTRDIPTVEGKLDTWRKLRDGAFNMLDMADGSGQYADPYMRSIMRHMGDAAVENFGHGADV